MLSTVKSLLRDIVVTAGVNRLREGQKVRLAEAARP